ncbi:MAG: class I SAM-dependent methyltransferase [Candidatus Kryptonium sp.]
MKISDEQLALFKLYKNAKHLEKIKIYARIIFNFQPIKKHLAPYIPNSGTVLDYGCGYGIFANYIKMKNEKLKVIGFDISKMRIDEARKTSDKTGVEFVDKLDDFKFDDLKLVLLVDVLIFLRLDEKIELLKKIYSSLTTGGIVFIKDTLKSNSFRFKYTYFEERLKLKLKVYGDNLAPELNYITPDEFAKILDEAGFKIVDLIPENQLIYPGIFIIARK